MKACLSLASWPGLRHEDAIGLLGERHQEPMFGTLSHEHVQLVPQSFGVLTGQVAQRLSAACPDVQFRLHANVRVLPEYIRADLSGFDRHRSWFEQAARISRQLRAPAYSAHAGRRDEASLDQMLDHARRCADLFECPVAVEGLYPTPHKGYLVATWGEYRALFESGVPYALDLSHLNIVAAQSGERDDGLVAEMLACDRCLEVHVSDNDGTGDQHRVCERQPWWWSMLGRVHPAAAIFSEGNRRTRFA